MVNSSTNYLILSKTEWIVNLEIGNLPLSKTGFTAHQLWLQKEKQRSAEAW